MTDHLSVTQLKMLDRCEVQYEFRYVNGIIAPPGVALVIGRATHESIGENMRRKVQGKEMLDATASADLAAETCAEEFSRGVVLDDGEKEQGEQTVRDNAVRMSAKLATVHREHLAPAIEPAYVERGFRLKAAGERDFTGYIDVQEKDGTIRDTKTSAKRFNQQTVDRMVQLTAYGLAVRSLDGPRASQPVALDTLLKTKGGGCETVKSTRAEADYRGLLDRLRLASKQLDAGIFRPTDPENWWCSRKFCGYWDRCPYGSARRTQG